MALEGTFKSSQDDTSLVLCCKWFGNPNYRTNKTSVTVYAYIRYKSIVVEECDIKISIGEFTKRLKSQAIDDAGNVDTNELVEVLIGSYTVNVPHDANGLREDLKMSVSWGFNGVYNNIEIGTIEASTTESLDKIPVYNLNIESDPHSIITVNRISSGAGKTGELKAGDTLYLDDTIRIYFSAIDDYQLATHKVNNYTFASGGTLIVDGEINVVCLSQEKIRQLFAPENMQCFCPSGEVLHPLYQWDKNVAITIKDVATNPPPVFQFANRHTETTIDVQAEASGDDIIVMIPDELLERPEAIFAHICKITEDSTRTLGSIHIPVYARARPQDSESTNEEEVKNEYYLL